MFYPYIKTLVAETFRFPYITITFAVVQGFCGLPARPGIYQTNCRINATATNSPVGSACPFLPGVNQNGLHPARPNGQGGSSFERELSSTPVSGNSRSSLGSVNLPPNGIPVTIPKPTLENLTPTHFSPHSHFLNNSQKSPFSILQNYPKLLPLSFLSSNLCKNKANELWLNVTHLSLHS